MIIFRPFHAWRPKPELAQKVACVPYDVISAQEAKKEIADNRLSFLRIVRSDADYSLGLRPAPWLDYIRAKDSFDEFKEQGIFIRESQPAIYIYRLQLGEHTQTGLVGCVAVDDYKTGRIKVHENTRPDKETDRTKHLFETEMHAEPVLLAYRNNSSLQQLINANTTHQPLYDFVAPDKIRHILWKATASAEISKACEQLDCLYIADGHHRAAAALRCSQEMATKGQFDQSAEFNFFPAAIFASSELKILPYNRIIKRMSFSVGELLAKIGENFTITESKTGSPQAPGYLCMYLEGKWYQLKARISCYNSSIQRANDQLDVAILFNHILAPIFGVVDQRTDNNIDFIGGLDSVSKLKKQVDSGEAALAFSLFPVSIEQLFGVADQDLLMPPKSTWFEPKLRSGLFVHEF